MVGKLPEKTKYFVDDIRLHVYDMRHLPEEVRSKFTSDMRIVAEYLADPGYVEHMEQKIKHPEALLRMLGALSKDGRYQELADKLEQDMEKGEMKMCELIQKYWDGGLKQGLEQGLESGIRALVMDNIEEGRDKDRVVLKLVKLFALDREMAEEYFDKYAEEADGCSCGQIV